MRTSNCLVAALLCLAPPAFAATPYEAGDLFEISQVESPQVSPDGKRVIFTRSFADIATDKRMGEVWLLTVGGGKQLLIGGQAGAGVRWSPDGSRIAYVAPVVGKPQLHVMTLAEGIGRAITTLRTPPSQIAWSPDGTSIAYAAQIDAEATKFAGMPTKPEGATWAPDARVVTSVRYRLNDGGYITPGFRHVFVVSANGGDPRQMTQGEFHHLDGDSPLSWTPDGLGSGLNRTRR